MPRIEALVRRITSGQWWRDDVSGPPTLMNVSLDRLLLHDGLARRARYMARTVLLPGPQHVEAFPLPRPLRFAYVPMALVHDLVALPLWRCYQQAIHQLERCQGALVDSQFALALFPGSSASRASVRLHGRARAEAKREIAANPNDAAAWRRLGDALVGLKRHKEAIACYDKALSVAAVTIEK